MESKILSLIHSVQMIFSRPVRMWLYGITAAAVPLATAYGVMTEEIGGAWLFLAGSILAGAELAMASAKTRQKSIDSERS